jgi:hypothetical protein
MHSLFNRTNARINKGEFGSSVERHATTRLRMRSLVIFGGVIALFGLTLPSATAANPSAIVVGSQSVAVTYGTAASPTFTISFTQNGNSGSYSGLSVSFTGGTPPGVTANLSATSDSVSGNKALPDQTLTLNTSITAAPGVYSFTLSTTSPTLTSNTRTLAIGKATPTLSVGNSPVIYNGSQQAATVNGSVAGGGKQCEVQWVHHGSDQCRHLRYHG